MFRAIALFASLFAALVPAAAEACSVCFSATDESRAAFIWTTVFLSVLPPAMIGGFVFWLVRRTRELERDGKEAGSGARPLLIE